mgnify:CR=1 FL=1
MVHSCYIEYIYATDQDQASAKSITHIQYNTQLLTHYTPVGRNEPKALNVLRNGTSLGSLV